MPNKTLGAEVDQAIRELKAQGKAHREIHKQLGVSVGYVSKVCQRDNTPDTHVVKDFHGDEATITVKSLNIHTLEQALEYSKVDLTTWEVDRFTINSWEVTSTSGENPATYTNYQVKAWLKRKIPAIQALETILERMEKASPITPKIRYVKPPKSKRRMLEVSLFDLHLGCRAFEPAANKAWSTEIAKTMALTMQEDILARMEYDGPYEYILYPIGNDFQHSDNVFHTTTQGTGQPEADSWHHVFTEAEGLLIQIIDRLKEVAPVRVVGVPGNHDRQSSFAIGRILAAYYRNDPNVQIDASSSPYKFVHYGINLIGFEHGHSIVPLRMAALMANECREAWAQTAYREWHLGDQHRKGSAKPSMFEEQGVSIEYLPALTPANEWHRLKGLNWQKRAAMAFVWDYDRGPGSRYQVNIDSYTGDLMGHKPGGR